MNLLTDEEWAAYKLQYRKTYVDATEEAMRRDIVAKCKEFIDEHNKKYEIGVEAFTYALNGYSDITEEEKCRRWFRVMIE